MNVDTVVVGEFQVNCHIVWDRGPEALVIDPGWDAEELIAHLERLKLKPAAYLLTHGHMDHIGALGALSRWHEAPTLIHPDDLVWAFDAENQWPPFYPPPERPPRVEPALTDGAARTDGGIGYRVIGTPGHSPGCVCILLDAKPWLFTGDTLFAGSVGRTDFPGGSTRQLGESLGRLARLPGETVIYPGHGPCSTIATEKATNYFLQSR
jgi:glyoxylase-like metal-dependent hydrolase (beta-lactamase superfamily II)